MSLVGRVLYLWQEERFGNLELRYVGASPFKHLNTMVTSLSFRRSFMDSHPRFSRTGEMWSYFLVYVRIPAAKFWTSVPSVNVLTSIAYLV